MPEQVAWNDTRSLMLSEDEVLTAADPQSPLGRLLGLPVINPLVNDSQLLELPWPPCSGNTGGLDHECDGTHRVVVLPLRYHAGSTPWRGTWDCRVVASDHPAYPVGGHDLSQPEAALRRARVIEVF